MSVMPARVYYDQHQCVLDLQVEIFGDWSEDWSLNCLHWQDLKAHFLDLDSFVQEPSFLTQKSAS